MADNLTLAEKLTRIQNELNAPKSRYNKFGGYAYRSAEDIQSALKPLLLKYNVTLSINDHIEQVGENIYIKATAALWDTTQPNGYTVVAYAREAAEKKGMDPAQVTGATISYANKYALNNMFLCDDTKDPDSEEYTKAQEGRSGGKGEHINPEPKAAPAAPKVALATSEQLDIIRELVSAKKIDINAVMSYYHLVDPSQLTVDQASTVIKRGDQK